MIRFPAQVSVQNPLTMRSIGLALVRLQRHEDGINLRELLRVVHLQRPSLLHFVIRVENAKAFHAVRLSELLSPDLIGLVGVHQLSVVLIKGVDDERFSLGQEDAAK